MKKRFLFLSFISLSIFALHSVPNKPALAENQNPLFLAAIPFGSMPVKAGSMPVKAGSMSMKQVTVVPASRITPIGGARQRPSRNGSHTAFPTRSVTPSPGTSMPAAGRVVPCTTYIPAIPEAPLKDQNQSKATASTKKEKKSKKKKTKKREILPPIICACKPESTDPNQKWVALTFDDGPSPVYTPKILAILKENKIHATFCVVGRQVKKCPELVKQIVADGHKIADHSMNHDERLPWRKDKKIEQEIMGEKTLIESVVPEASVEYYRAPGGVWSAHLRKMVAGWGMKALGWSVDTNDWQHPGVENIVATVENRVQNGAVILMHDGGGDRSESVDALKKIIPKLRESGYEFAFPQ